MKGGKARPQGKAGVTPCLRLDLRAGVAVAQLAARKHRVVRCIGDLIGWGDFDDFHEIEFILGVLFAAHDHNVLKALVVIGTVQRRTIAHAIEFKPFESFSNTTWVEGASALAGVCLQQGLNLACMR